MTALIYKTLVIDADPQANVTKTMLLTKNYNSDNDDIFIVEKTMMAGIVERDIEQLIIPIIDNLYCIPSHIDFKNFNKYLTRLYGEAIEELDDNYIEVERNRISELKPLVETFGSNTDVVGILPNQLSKGTIDTTVIDDAKKTFGDQNLFNSIIPFVKRVQSTPRTGLNRDTYWDNLAYDEVFVPLTEDFLKRINMFEGGPN